MSLPEESNLSRRGNEAFSDYQETRGSDPKRPHSGKIDLSPGRIKSIEFHEGSIPGAETERIPTYEIILNVVPDYREIRGLRDFSISTLTIHEGNAVDIRWVGNDIGVGVIDSLNADKSLKASILELLGGPPMIHHLYIKAEPSGADLGFLGWSLLAGSGIHPPVMPETGPARYLTISIGWVSSSGTIPDISSGKLPNCFLGIARHLLACTPEPTTGIGDDSAVRSVSPQHQIIGSMINSPHIIYDIAVFALLSLGTLGIGIFAFYSAMVSSDWLGANGKGWVVVGGIVALSLALWGSTVTVNRVSMMKAGLHYLNGKVGRKWVTTDDKGNPARCYIRVEGHPFKVSRHVYEWLSEGHQVVVAFWGQAHLQTVARVDKLYRTFLQTLDENKMKSHVPVVTARDDTGGRPEQFTDRFDDRFD